MRDVMQKANLVLLILLVVCVAGFVTAKLHKVKADVPNCNDIGSPNCDNGYEPAYREMIGTACATVNSTDCCLYEHWRISCYDTSVLVVYPTHSYMRRIGVNRFKDCQQGRCVPFPTPTPTATPSPTPAPTPSPSPSPSPSPTPSPTPSPYPSPAPTPTAP